MKKLRHPISPRLLAINVWRLRENRRLTADALAEKLGCPLGQVLDIENGDADGITLNQLEALALALSVELPELLGRRTIQ